MLQDHKIITAQLPDNITLTINAHLVLFILPRNLTTTINATLDQTQVNQLLFLHVPTLDLLSILTVTSIVKVHQQLVFSTNPTASLIHQTLVDGSRHLSLHQLSLSITFLLKMLIVDQEVPEEPQMEETVLQEEMEQEL